MPGRSWTTGRSRRPRPSGPGPTTGATTSPGWRRTRGPALNVIRLEAGFAAGTAPVAVLYLLLRHAVLRGLRRDGAAAGRAAHGAGRRDIVRDAGGSRRSFTCSERTQASESRFARLYAPDPAVTGDPSDARVGLHPRDHRDVARGAGTRRAARRAAASWRRCRPRASNARSSSTSTAPRTALDAWRLGLATEKLFELRYPATRRPESPAVPGVHIGAYGWLEEVRPRSVAPTPVALTGELADVFAPPGASPLTHDPANQGYIHAPSPARPARPRCCAAATGRRSPANPGTLAVNLSSDRVRVALTFLDGIRAGQSLGALLGYRLERGLHDRHAIAETDRFIKGLRQAFPLVAAKLPRHRAPRRDGDRVARGAQRHRRAGAGPPRDPERAVLVPVRPAAGVGGLPFADADQTGAIDAEVAGARRDQRRARRSRGRRGRAPGRARQSGSRGGEHGRLHQDRLPARPRRDRHSAHGAAAQPPGRAAAARRTAPDHLTGAGAACHAARRRRSRRRTVARGPAARARERGVPGHVDGPGHAVARSAVVSQADLGLQPIDLLWMVRPTEQATMTELDDRIVARVLHTETLRADTELVLRYTDPIAGKVSLFQLSPLVDALRALLLAARPAGPATSPMPAGGDTLDPHADDGVDLPRARPKAVRDAAERARPARSTGSSPT